MSRDQYSTCRKKVLRIKERMTASGASGNFICDMCIRIKKGFLEGFNMMALATDVKHGTLLFPTFPELVSY